MTPCILSNQMLKVNSQCQFLTKHFRSCWISLPPFTERWPDCLKTRSLEVLYSSSCSATSPIYPMDSCPLLQSKGRSCRTVLQVDCCEGKGGLDVSESSSLFEHTKVSQYVSTVSILCLETVKDCCKLSLFHAL